MSNKFGYDERGYLHLPARVIAPPRHVSDIARRVFSSPPLVATDEPEASDKPAWRARIVARTVEIDARLAEREKALPCAMATMSLQHTTLYEVTPETISNRNEHRAMLFLHGGGFTVGGGRAAGVMSFATAIANEIRTFSPDYRMPPDHPFPAGLDDCVDAYRAVIARFKPANVAVGGISAGGGLAAATILRLRDSGLPMPGAAFFVSPESDLTESGDSFETNRMIDMVLGKGLAESIKLYADGRDLTDPYLSPNYADFTAGFPPSVLITGTRDLFLSNAVNLHRALRRAGIVAELHVFEAMPHGGFFGAPEDHEALREQALFLDRQLGAD